jgi:hypothetical protein
MEEALKWKSFAAAAALLWSLSGDHDGSRSRHRAGD